MNSICKLKNLPVKESIREQPATQFATNLYTSILATTICQSYIDPKKRIREPTEKPLFKKFPT